jgi:hypothetical protein
MEWVSFSYTMMSFALKNALAVFSKIVIDAFKEFIHKFLEFYLDVCKLFILLKEHMQSSRMMLGQVSLALDFLKFEKVHLLYTFWQTTVGGPIKNCFYTIYGGSHHCQEIVCHLGSHTILLVVYSNL